MALLGAAQGQGSGSPGGGQGISQGQGGPRQHVVRITEQEKAHIDNLCNLGFSRQRALEAYLICDKNEELAANYLLENGDDTNMGEG